jgi:diacylglycerol kinase family enzyme
MESRPRRIALVANPISGRGRGVVALRELEAELRARGALVEATATTKAGDARAIAASVAADAIVAIGGDGTLSEVVDGAAGRAVDIAQFPLGTANVLARDLALPRDAGRAADMVLAGRTVQLDTALVECSGLPAPRRGFLVLGAGFDGHAVHELARLRRGAIGKLAWARAIAGAFGSWRVRTMRATVHGPGGASTHECESLLVANCVHYGGFDVLDRSRRLDDGLFEVYLFARASRASLVRIGLAGAFARLPAGVATLLRASRVTIESDEPVPVQLDGDAAGSTPARLEVDATRTRLLVPWMELERPPR